MSSIEHIRSTPGFAGRSWPKPEMTPDENLGDLRRHAEDFAGRRGFTYTVLANSSGEIVGCVYIYPPEDPGSAAADVRSWVRSDRADLDAQVHDAVTGWLRASWPFPSVDYAPR